MLSRKRFAVRKGGLERDDKCHRDELKESLFKVKRGKLRPGATQIVRRLLKKPDAVVRHKSAK